MNKSEFEKELSDYTMSSDTKEMLLDTPLALFAAPTSGGRNTIFKHLIKTNKFIHALSDTTRKPRINDGIMEKNGVEYWFRSEEEVLADLRAKRYVEAAIIHDQHVSGLRQAELSRIKQSGKFGLKDIEMTGVDTYINTRPDVIVFFVLPPGFDEWQRRIKHRGEMNPKEKIRRIKSAALEFEHALSNNYYQFVVNDDINQATEEIMNRCIKGQIDISRHELGRSICKDLLSQTKKYLKLS